MEFTGKIIAILPPRGGVSKTSGNEWKSQEYVIENHDQYPRKMCFDVFGADKIEQFNIQMGEELTVSFDVDARHWIDLVNCLLISVKQFKETCLCSCCSFRSK